MKVSGSSDKPAYYNLLSDTDKMTYDRIRQAITAPSNKNKKNKRADEFREILEAIELYENHDQADKWKRCLVCGVFIFDKGIAIKISALKQLIYKCKSSINGSLKAIGYPNVDYKSSMCDELLNGIPFLRGNLVELRQWTVRFRDRNTPTSLSIDNLQQYISPPSNTLQEKNEDINGINIDIVINENSSNSSNNHDSWLLEQPNYYNEDVFDDFDI
ncbi:hypothetical protein TVAG_179670 [Trichomonas vaginalis G3]|uniref:Initiator binding domain-containing protein n=1 Tax=Trichomonas vaginalis (strain ATCC PRA-98 / G3) TaxID=412133 RepID=A2F449_TRIV3|nr:transcription-initiator DNA-binding domain ibd family [Trichomonas vaginalis G3]EAY00296.1 hypothetical protein TVAG_179670 [Trichomonas vaginalis G3]KAI5490869.1 transcription-initiator DNA-binding domain ibd family [Trichomonas vaginalis G3]|eukprot:XP_001313225.1 hypothetical protein [Trichomonas vaginalis G3]